LLLVFGVLIKLPMFTRAHVPAARPEDGFFYRALLKFLAPAGQSAPILYPVIAFGLLFIQAILLTRFINNQRMMSRANYFPGMAYLLVTSLFPEWNYFSAPLIVNTFLLLILVALFSVYNQNDARGRVFNIGLLLGIAAFVFFPAVTFIIWILLALMVMRPFRLNEWALCILGLTTPFYFYAIYLFITGEWSWERIIPHFSVSMPFVQQSAWLAGSTFLLVVPFLTGGYYVQDNLRKMLIQVRKGWSLLLLYLVGAFLLPFMNNSGNFENWVIMVIPFAAFHACAYFYSSLRFFPLLLFWISTGFVLAWQYMGPGW
jgi:hypothetical protein